MGPLLLVPDILLFLAAAAACFALGLWRAKGEDPNEAATSSTGTEMRRRLQLLLLLANAARAVGLVVETVLFEDGICPGAWTCALVRGGPDLLFLTTYSMLILFWAQVGLWFGCGGSFTDRSIDFRARTASHALIGSPCVHPNPANPKLLIQPTPLPLSLCPRPPPPPTHS